MGVTVRGWVGLVNVEEKNVLMMATRVPLASSPTSGDTLSIQFLHTMS